MPEGRFLPAPRLQGYALHTIPDSRIFMIECRSCGTRREISREVLQRAGQYLTLDELAPRFRCSLCGEKNADIMAGDSAAGIGECRTGSPPVL